MLHNLQGASGKCICKKISSITGQKMMRQLYTALAIYIISISLTMAEGNTKIDKYTLGPQDKIEIRIHDLRTGTGEAHQWAAFDGDFLVNASGVLSLPLLGEVQASGYTTEELAKTIALQVQTKVGLAQLPSASVQITKYRPFYIVGDIDKPGEYEYRPGLTVLQASSIAGGLTRSSNDSILTFEREALTQRGELRTLAAERQGLIVRQIRLAAEIADGNSLNYTQELKNPSSGGDISRAIAEETLLFNARRSTLKDQILAIENSKKLLQSQIDSFTNKDVVISRQIDLIQKELTQVTGLVSKGLAVAPRQFAVEQSVAAYESTRIDTQVGRLRAQQELSRAERDVIDLKSKYKNDALAEAGEVRVKIQILNERIETASKLIYQSEVRAPASITVVTNDIRPIYDLTTSVAGKIETRSVLDSDKVGPGDVLRVSIPRRAAEFLKTDSRKAGE